MLWLCHLPTTPGLTEEEGRARMGQGQFFQYTCEKKMGLERPYIICFNSAFPAIRSENVSNKQGVIKKNLYGLM